MENDKSDKELILGQWQTCVEMANSISQRRDSMNNLFTTLNIALVAAISIMWDIKSVFVIVAGTVVCVLWIFFIRNFKLLNEEKFKVICEIEKELPVQPLNDEWAQLRQNREYKEGTRLEQFLPIVFILLYATTALAIIIIKIAGGGI